MADGQTVADAWIRALAGTRTQLAPLAPYWCIHPGEADLTDLLAWAYFLMYDDVCTLALVVQLSTHGFRTLPKITVQHARHIRLVLQRADIVVPPPQRFR